MTPPTTDSAGTDHGADTFDRSCRHWSTSGRTGMDAFYQLATEDYRRLAAAYDWPTVMHGLPRRDGRLRLADIACGSGQFPAALLTRTDVGRLDLHIDYDLLDPSRFSIDTARNELARPFVAGAEYECTAQHWPVEPASYSMIWAIHALYCVPESDLAAVAEKIATGLVPGGVGLVAQSTRAGHYCRFYDLFCRALAPDRTPYSDSRQVADALADAGLAIAVSELNYDTRIAADNHQLQERYLQRCAFDDEVSLETMRAASPLADYLAACETDNATTFKQQAGVVVFAHRFDDLRTSRLNKPARPL